jgi:uncharacterized damage-inducible protein DinB
MITVDYVRTMARYNAWQNGAIYGVAGGLSDKERRMDRGAFFGSIHATLSHLVWADTIWMSRFGDIDPPPGGIETSANYYSDWDRMATARADLDAVIRDWAQKVDPDWLTGELTWYSTVSGGMTTRSTALLVAHFFNHQTHHRGQVHAMLTAAGAKTEMTDLGFMPAEA